MWLTVKLSVLSTVLGFLLGTACAIGRSYGPAWMRRTIGAYVEAIRNTPLLVQVFIVFFGLSSLGLVISTFTAAIAALVINIGAYTTEIVRAGIESVQQGQVEAARTLGLQPLHVVLLIVLVPALERVYPALTSQYVLLMLASSITSQISAEELTAIVNRVQSDTFRSFEVYLVAGVLYLLLSWAMRGLLWAGGQALFPRRRRLGAVV